MPADQVEEVLLLLSLLEDSQSRGLSFGKYAEVSVAIVDLLTAAYTRRRYPGLLLEYLEKALAYPAGEQFLWHQFALALTASGRYARALTALEVCLLRPVALPPC